MTAQRMVEDVTSLTKFFILTTQKHWKDVESFYTTNVWSQKTKLTKSGDTALHIIVSNYHPQRDDHNANIVEKMVGSISQEEAFEVLSMKNDRGSTPLHLAAKVGRVDICIFIASRDPKLATIRNANGETPLFVAACHGETEAFICLYEIYKDWKEKDQNLEESQAQKEKDHESEESLCRRKSDGNTALHLAITGAYFELAYQIIEYFPELVNSVNVDGESPLHVLAKMPRLFNSSSRMGLYDSIIYYCITIKELTQQRHNLIRAKQNVISPPSVAHYPENYQTGVKIFRLLWVPIYKTCQAILGRGTGNIEHGGRNDTESQRTTRNVSQKEKSRVQSYFPAILLFSFAVKVISSVLRIGILGGLGIGFWRMKRIQDNKKRHSHAIMDKMIESESRYNFDQYKYDIDGQKKLEPYYLVQFRPPKSPPASPDESGIISSNDVQNNPGKVMSTETPLLVAASMGIPEMVQKILTTCPVAIHDLDLDGKNVVLLAAEHKQPTVFDLLLKMKHTEDLFHQVDNQGNSILHLAARMGTSTPWHIAGAALQMQWELKWYKHVKHSIPPYYLGHKNLRGCTPSQVFTKNHKELVEEGTKWLIKTSESCSFVTALIATVAFATSTTVPGGLDDEGRPILRGHEEFYIFSISSFIALCLSVTALVFFLAIITSRSEKCNFNVYLLRKLLYGLTSLFASIVAMLVSFCVGHTFILKDKLRNAAVPIYAFAGVPVTLFALEQLRLYFDLVQASYGSFKAFYQ